MCPRCNGEITVADEFCEHCKLDLSPLMSVCKKCGHKIHEWLLNALKAYNYCTFCAVEWGSHRIIPPPAVQALLLLYSDHNIARTYLREGFYNSGIHR